MDPLAEKYAGWSPYNYVMNNPLGMVDPDGRCPESLKKEGDTYVCPLTLDGGEINAISDKTYRERREYLAGGDYMLEGLGKGFLYMVAGGAGIYAGGAYLAGAGIETAATSFLTHKTVIQGAQIATEILQTEAGLVGVGGAAAVGAKLVAKEAAEVAGEGRTTVLGHYPQYVKVAEAIGARTFQIPTKIWDKLTPPQQWEANQKFLDRMILRGDNIRLATPLNQVKPGSFYQKELNYLFEKGYKVSYNGLWMVK